MKLVPLTKSDAPDPARVEREIDLSIGRRIRRRRKLLGMTQRDLAAVLGLQSQQIQKYECSASRISASRLQLLAAALNVPISYFLVEFSNGGRSNESERAVTATADLLSERESRELLDAYAKLPARLRQTIRELAKDLGDEVHQVTAG